MELIFLIMSFLMIGTGLLAKEDFGINWGLWIFGLFGQFLVFYFIFINTDSLRSIFDGTQHITYYQYVMQLELYRRVFLWITIILCSIFSILTILSPWLELDSKEDKINWRSGK